MQQKLRLNPHGVAGVLSIILMFGIAFFLNWNVNWWYFSIAVLLYSVAIIFFSRMGFFAFKWLLGCHLALLFLAVRLLIHFPNYTGAFGFHGGDNDIRPFYFLVSVLGGLAIPFMLLRTREEEVDGQTTRTAGQGTPTRPDWVRSSGYGASANPYTNVAQPQIILHIGFNPQGIVALLLIITMFGVAFFYSWSFVWLYWFYFIATILLYTVACVLLNPDIWPHVWLPRDVPSPVKLQLACKCHFDEKVRRAI